MARISAEEKKRVRNNLLNTAAAHFAAHGYDGASINRISTDAGYAKGTVYGYFDSKAALFTAVLDIGSDETIRLYEQAEHDGTTRGKLLAVAEADVKVVRAHEPFMRVMIRELMTGHPETRKVIEAGSAALLRLVAEILLSGRRAGEVRCDRSVAQQTTIFSMQLIMLYAQHGTSAGAFPTWDELPRLAVDLFLDGCGR